MEGGITYADDWDRLASHRLLLNVNGPGDIPLVGCDAGSGMDEAVKKAADEDGLHRHGNDAARRAEDHSRLMTWLGRKRDEMRLIGIVLLTYECWCKKDVKKRRKLGTRKNM